MDENRKAFEAYVTGPKFGMPTDAIRIDPETGEYSSNLVQDFWLVWQASREAVVVELPEWFDRFDSGDRAYWVEDVEKAIKAAGIRTK